MTEIEIAAHAELVADGAAQPDPFVRLSDVERLLNAAAAVERARRPIVIHQAAPVVAAPVTHAGIDVTIPTVTHQHPWPCLHRWSGPLGRVSLGVALLGAGDLAWTQGSALGAVLMAAGMVGAGVGMALSAAEENREARS